MKIIHDILGPTGKLSQVLPYFKYRSQQEEMAKATAEVFQEGGILLCEAPTGIGKTFAYLIPAILSGRKVVVSTATRALQEQIFFKDLPLVRQAVDKKFSAVYMKGRGNYLCLRRFEAFLKEPTFMSREEARLFNTVVEWAGTTASGDRAEVKEMPAECAFWNEIASSSDYCLFKNCPRFEDCFLTRLKRRAADAELIVVNHYLFFADLALRGDYSQVIPRYEAIIFDEAHHLEETATQYFGVSVSNFRIGKLLGDLRRELRTQKTAHWEDFQTVTEPVAGAAEVFFFHALPVGDRRRLRSGDVQPAPSQRLNAALKSLADRLTGPGKDNPALALLAERSLRIADDLNFVSAAKEEDFVFWSEPAERGVFLHASPIEVGKYLTELLYPEMAATIMTSATLAVQNRMSYLRRGLGMEASDLKVKELTLFSPFPLQKQAVIYVPREIATPDHEDFTAHTALEMEGLLKISHGRAFLLFTSYQQLEKIYQRLKPKVDYLLLKQGEAPTQELLRRFVEEGPAVLFATSSFWEGVDVRGEALSAVIVDKLPFAVPTEPIVEGRLEALTKKGLNAFMDYQVPMAVLKLKQGLGRLIRSEEDRGILAILDSRLYLRRYGRIFFQSFPPCPVADNLAAVRKFFGNEVTKGN